jgi:sugar-specific transcriptional regulator TrmB
MLVPTLQQFGLDDKEITAYLRLLKYGATRASTLAYLLAQPRTSIQHILERLEKQNLVLKTRDRNTYLYSAVHPEELIELLEVRRRQKNYEFQKLENDLETVMPQLLGMMQSNRHIPNIQFYRGRAGVRQVLFDTLTSKTELKGFVNVDAMNKEVMDINKEYVEAREKTDIKKRGLILDTPYARKDRESGKYSPKSYIGWKWIPKDLYPFTIEMNIYDGKVSYLTYVENDLIGVIIENDYIYEMHNSMWNLIWDSLPAS